MAEAKKRQSTEARKRSGIREDKFTWKPGDVQVFSSMEEMKKATSKSKKK